MRQIAYPAALGGCALGAEAPPLWAAEWSMTPTYTSSVDYDSNRRLVSNGTGTGATVLTADVRFKRALETWDVYIEPRYSWRRYSDKTLGNGDDRSIYGGFDWSGPRSLLNLTASYWDQSVLLAEALETGITTNDSHRRMGQVGGTWTWAHTERRQTITQLNYQGVSYSAKAQAQLPGYRYWSGSIGERFDLSERMSFTLSGYGSLLSSDTPGNASHTAGLQAQVIYAVSERTRLDASVGESSHVLARQSSHGTDASVSLTHSYSRANAALGYTRSLVPYGTGFLVQREQFTVSLGGSLTEHLNSNLSFVRVQNNQTAVLLRLDRREYNNLNWSFEWRPFENWGFTALMGATRTVLPDLNERPVHGWHTAVGLTWTPRVTSRSW